jgi:hypothetical protein
MSTVFADFAVCPCGEQSPIRPTKPATSNASPLSSEKDENPIFVACWRCKRVYMYDTRSLVSLPIEWGLAPDNPQSPIRIFRVPIECDEPNCQARPLVHVTLNSNTTAEKLQKEKAAWRWSETVLRCHLGHKIPWPQWEHGQ